VLDREPPEPTTGEQVERLYKRSVATDVQADEATASAYRELLEVRRALKPLTEREERLTDNIKLFLRDRDTLIVDGAPACTWRTAKAACRFDTKAFQLESPDVYAKFLTQSQPSRRFLIKERD
jgi:predicted phage-related endonuclease